MDEDPPITVGGSGGGSAFEITLFFNTRGWKLQKIGENHVITIPPDALWQAETAAENGLVYFETPNARLRIAEVDDMTVDNQAPHAPLLAPKAGQGWEVDFKYQRV
jgi:hypothetical protein